MHFSVEDLADLVMPHVDRAELTGVLERFYADTDLAIAAHAPICHNRGECCQFETFGHSLFVTTLELVYFVRGQRATWLEPSNGSCPYQQGGQCTARPHRPLGCRVFYCDPADKDWQGPEYESRLMALRRLGAEYGVVYRYVEWLSALRALSSSISKL